MACLFAARLSAAGVSVTMLGTWKAGMAALGQDGVCLLDADGCKQAYPVRVVSDPKDVDRVQHALVMVKSWQTERAAQQLRVCLAEDGLAISLQNGLGNYETLSRYLGLQRVTMGVTTVGAVLLKPGCVRSVGLGVVTLGYHARSWALADLLNQAGFVLEPTADLNALVWGKLVINAAINPLTALLDVPIGELLRRPATLALLAAVARETAAVAVAKGIRLLYPDPVVAVENIARNTADSISSMLQDVRRGAQTEIDAINGAIVRAGEQVGVSTPINRTLWLLVKGLPTVAA